MYKHSTFLSPSPSLSPSFSYFLHLYCLFFSLSLSSSACPLFLCLPSLPLLALSSSLSPPLLSQLLGMLLRDKSHLVNSNILHLTFTLVGTVDNEHESARISNTIAFKDLLAGTLLYYMFIVVSLDLLCVSQNL